MNPEMVKCKRRKARERCEPAQEAEGATLKKDSRIVTAVPNVLNGQI
jgi:hypothetical protein